MHNMKTPPRFAILAAASLAFCFQAPLCAEEKPVPATQQKKLTVEDHEQLNKATAASSEAANLYGKGKPAEAENLWRAALAIRERVLGAEHPDTLSSRMNLALVLLAQGTNPEAQKELRAVLAIRERVLGAEHPDTLMSRNCLALTLQFQGKHAEVEKEHRAVLAIQERVLGAEHPDVFQSCYNLAVCLKVQKKLPEALAFMQRAETGRAKVLGPEHPYSKLAKEGRERIEADLKKHEVGGK